METSDTFGARDGARDLAIETVQLSKRYGDKFALDGLDLRIQRGQIHAMVGANGAGKSTLFRILLGFLSPSDGQAHPGPRQPAADARRPRPHRLRQRRTHAAGLDAGRGDHRDAAPPVSAVAADDLR